MASVKPNGAAIRALRRGQNLSQEAVAMLSRDLPRPLIPVSDRTIRSAERGVRVKEESVASIAAVLKADSASLIEEDRDPHPFRGLHPFGFGDHQQFGGRDEPIRRGVTRLREQGALLVAGPSGSGKSSLCLSGIAPALFAEVPGSLFLLVRPRVHARRALARTLAESLAVDATLPDAVETAARFATMLEKDDDALAEILAAAAVRGAFSEALIYLDQAEELCTMADDSAPFLRLLNAAFATQGNPVVRCMVSIRSEYAGHFMHMDAQFAQRFSGAELIVRRMTDPELRDAIERPMRAAGLTYEPALVELIMRDARHEPGYLPHIQFLLDQLWRMDGAQEARLTLERYREVGGLSGVISRHASTVYRALSTEDQALAQAVLPRLVATSEGAQDVAAVRLLSDFELEGRSLLNHLAEAEARLVEIEEGSNGAAQVRFSHEEIIRQWPELQEWLRFNIEEVAAREQLERDLHFWRESGEQDDYLLPLGPRLRNAKNLIKRLHPGSRPTEAERFLKISRQVALRRSRIGWGFIAAAVILVTVYVGSDFVQHWLREQKIKRFEIQFAALSSRQDIASLYAPTSLFFDPETRMEPVDGDEYRTRIIDYISEDQVAVRNAFPEYLALCPDIDTKTFEALILSRVDFGPYIERCGRTQLFGISFAFSSLMRAIFPNGMALNGSNLAATSLRRVNFSDTDLTGTNLSCAWINGANFGHVRAIDSTFADTVCLFDANTGLTLPPGVPLPQACAWTLTEDPEDRRQGRRDAFAFFETCARREHLYALSERAMVAIAQGRTDDALITINTMDKVSSSPLAALRRAHLHAAETSYDAMVEQYLSLFAEKIPRLGTLRSVAQADVQTFTVEGRDPPPALIQAIAQSIRKPDRHSPPR